MLSSSGMFRRLAAGLLLRRLSRDLTSLVEAVQLQNLLLGRLVDHFAPAPSGTVDRPALRDTGLSFLDLEDASRALSYIDKTRLATGHTPDEDEVLSYLADEKTTDLAARLADRDLELERLAERRRAES